MSTMNATSARTGWSKQIEDLCADKNVDEIFADAILRLRKINEKIGLSWQARAIEIEIEIIRERLGLN